jgi:hypothetical protein
MKLKQHFSLFVVSALSQSFVFVYAKKNSIKGPDQPSTKDKLRVSRALQISSQDNLSEPPTSAEKTVAPRPVVASSASSSSSSSLLRRGLKKDSSKHFFFEECSETCAETGGVPTTLDDHCCDGGVSFLKVKFHAQDHIEGTITIGSAHSLSCENIQGQYGSSSKDSWHSSKGTSKGTKSGSIPKAPSQSESSPVYEHRLVDCNAKCVQDPFGVDGCDDNLVMNEKKVKPGTEICIATVQSEGNETQVAFDVKMPIEVSLLFLSAEGFSVGAIHTSCSVALSSSYGVRLDDPCDHTSSGIGKKIHARNRHINVDEIVDDSTPYLSFIDGISTKYFNAVEYVACEDDTESYLQDFSVGFNNCGCTCERYNAGYSSAPSASPSLSDAGAVASSVPSKSPTSVPTFVPTLAPLIDPTPSPVKLSTASPSSKPSSAPTEASTSGTSSSTSEMSPGNPGKYLTDFNLLQPIILLTHYFSSLFLCCFVGPASPPFSTCSSECAAFVFEHCVFAGTNDACIINADVPAFADDDDEIEGAIVATLSPTGYPTAATSETFSAYGKGKSGKGTKGAKGYGKGWYYGKDGKKGAKASRVGKATEAEYGRKKAGEAMSHPGSKLAESKLAGQSIGKAGKGGKANNSSGYDRNLRKIEYHQSQIDHLKKLMMHLEVARDEWQGI